MSSYVSIMSQILNYNKLTDDTDATNEELELRGAGSAITPIAKSAQKILENREASKNNTTKKEAIRTIPFYETTTETTNAR